MDLPDPHLWVDALGGKRNDSIPLNEQIINCFKQGDSYENVLWHLEIKKEELSFDELLKIIGAKDAAEYSRLHKKYQRATYQKEHRAGAGSNNNKARELYQNKCAICGSPVGINVHHVLSYRESKNSNLDNLVVLCYLHHSAAHGKFPQFLYHELFRASDEKIETPYTKNGLEHFRNKAKTSNIFFVEGPFLLEARKTLYRYQSEYVEYVNGHFAVKMEVSKPCYKTKDGIHIHRISQIDPPG